MTARLSANLRSGHLAEELGVLLLKGVAAVAAVAHPDDVGTDAVATLLRAGPGNLLFAENTFYVQFKAASVDIVEYDEHGVRWLEALKLPFCIARVDRKSATIDLYAAHRLSQVFTENTYDRIEVVLNCDNNVQLGMNTATEAWDGKTRRVDIGPPLARWNLEETADRETMNRVYLCLKPYLVAEQQNVESRPLRRYRSIAWTTNEVPLVGGYGQILSDSDEEGMPPLMQTLGPVISALQMRGMDLSGEKSMLEMAMALIDLARRYGVEHDPHNVCQFLHRQLDAEAQQRGSS